MLPFPNRKYEDLQFAGRRLRFAYSE